MPGPKMKKRTKQKGQKTPNFSNRDNNSRSGGGRIKKMEDFEDTLEPGSVDEHMFKRNQIMFNPQDESDNDEIEEDGEEVLSLDKPKASRRKARDTAQEEEEYDEDDVEDEARAPAVKQRKEKKKADLTTKGRFGKPIVSSDEEEDGQGSGSASGSGSGSDTDEERWGRQYYSRPSTRKEKEELRGEVDVEKRDEEREMEVKEVRRLQRKAREGMGGDDWGFGDDEDELDGADDYATKGEEAATRKAPAPAPETTDPAALLRHLETHEPVKLALVRDFPLIAHNLEKTAKGIKKMMAEQEEGEETLHKGLGWMHYQSLLTYATTLAFYIHLAALPPASRPDLASHPIVNRLLQLKEGVSMLEDLDFAAGQDSDEDPLLMGEDSDDEELDEDDDDDDDDGEDDEADKGLSLKELKAEKKKLLAQLRIEAANGDDSDQEEEEDDDLDLMRGDVDDSWKDEDLEDGELEDLLRELQEEEEEAEEAETIPVAQASTKGKKLSKKAKKRAQQEKTMPPSTSSTLPAPLAEPAFYTSKKSKSDARRRDAEDDTLGDPTALLEADAADKERRTKSLRFHTSKIAATSARRSAARNQRLTGDEDVPYRDRQAARDAALRRNGPAAVGEPLGSDEVEMKEKKRARQEEDEMDDGDDGEGDAADGYYELVKRRKTEKKDARQAAHDEQQAEKFAYEEDESASGPRGLTRAIEKNRGLTPHRSKTGRNPRVKKRLAYEKAKQKVGSQRAVFKGGQAALGGQYGGEKTGISTVVKSRKF